MMAEKQTVRTRICAPCSMLRVVARFAAAAGANGRARVARVARVRGYG